jgi:hypothetical protein
MRCLLKVSIPNEKGNQLAREGRLGSVIQSILEDLKPEAAYFYEEKGQRTGLIVTNIEDPSGIPAAAEPLFLGLDAAVEFHPAMVPEDLAKAGPAIEDAVKKYG